MKSAQLTTILFDLDGTLLPLDQNQFMHGYFNLFGKRCSMLGYDGSSALAALQAGIKAMLGNDGTVTNKERFDQTFESMTGIPSSEFNARFAPFYEEEFHQLKSACKPTSLASELVELVRDKGYDVVLATTPLFPRQATYARLEWASLDPSLFSMVTTYEDFCYAKPHLGYYQQILKRCGVDAQDCLMIGNDVNEDLVAQSLGMEVYLVTDCLINENNLSTESYCRGSLQDLSVFCKELAVCH